MPLTEKQKRDWQEDARQRHHLARGRRGDGGNKNPLAYNIGHEVFKHQQYGNYMRATFWALAVPMMIMSPAFLPSVFGFMAVGIVAGHEYYRYQYQRGGGKYTVKLPKGNIIENLKAIKPKELQYGQNSFLTGKVPEYKRKRARAGNPAPAV